ATPSLSETRRASSSSDACSRSATLLLLISILSLLPRRWRRHGEDPECLRHRFEMMQIESHKAIRAAVYRCLQNHLIRRILQLGPPKEPQLNGIGGRGQGIQYSVRFPDRQTGGHQLMRPGQYGFVFDQ